MATHAGIAGRPPLRSAARTTSPPIDGGEEAPAARSALYFGTFHAARQRHVKLRSSPPSIGGEVPSAARRSGGRANLEPYAIASRLDLRQPAHVGLEHFRNRYAAVLLLVVFHDGDQRAADRGAGAVQRMDEGRALAFLGRGSGRPCAAPGNRRRPSRTKSRDRRSVRAARPRCRRSSARRNPCRRCRASRCGTAVPSFFSTASAHSVMRSCSARELSWSVIETSSTL